MIHQWEKPNLILVGVAVKLGASYLIVEARRESVSDQGFGSSTFLFSLA